MHVQAAASAIETTEEASKVSFGSISIVDLKQFTKVDVPNSNIAMISTPIFEWCVVRCGSKNGNQKEMCLEEIGQRAQNMLSFLGFIFNIIWGTHMTI
jgi:hypothetical protein